MRALIVCAAPSEGSVVLVARESLSADLVCAVDGGAQLCVEASVVPALVVGDLDSIDTAVLSRLEDAGVPIEKHPAAKDESDLALAIDACVKRGCSDIVVSAAVGHRIDHTLAALGEMAERAMSASIRFVEPGMSGWLLGMGQTWEADAWRIGVGRTVSIIALRGPARVNAVGWRWNLDAQRLEPLSSRGLSNIVADAGAQVEVVEGLVVVIHEDI
jgi:thiamine pyrophosphokinase